MVDGLGKCAKGNSKIDQNSATLIKSQEEEHYKDVLEARQHSCSRLKMSTWFMLKEPSRGHVLNFHHVESISLFYGYFSSIFWKLNQM